MFNYMKLAQYVLPDLQIDIVVYLDLEVDCFWSTHKLLEDLGLLSDPNFGKVKYCSEEDSPTNQTPSTVWSYNPENHIFSHGMGKKSFNKSWFDKLVYCTFEEENLAEKIAI